jgi:hypothetical protein
VISPPVIGGNPEIEALPGMDPIPEVAIPPEALSRDPEVGRAYAGDRSSTTARSSGRRSSRCSARCAT